MGIKEIEILFEKTNTIKKINIFEIIKQKQDDSLIITLLLCVLTFYYKLQPIKFNGTVYKSFNETKQFTLFELKHFEHYKIEAIQDQQLLENLENNINQLNDKLNLLTIIGNDTYGFTEEQILQSIDYLNN